jgi:hypothetical protein
VAEAADSVSTTTGGTALLLAVAGGSGGVQRWKLLDFHWRQNTIPHHSLKQTYDVQGPLESHKHQTNPCVSHRIRSASHCFKHALGWMEEFAGSSPIPSVHQPSVIATFSRQIYATCSLRQPPPTTAAATFYLGNTAWGRNIKYFFFVYYSHFIWIQNQYLTTS